MDWNWELDQVSTVIGIGALGVIMLALILGIGLGIGRLVVSITYRRKDRVRELTFPKAMPKKPVHDRKKKRKLERRDGMH